MTRHDERVQSYDSRGDKNAMARWIVWLAILASHLLLAGLAVFLRWSFEAEQHAAELHIQLVLGIVAVSFVPIAILAPKLMSRMEPTALAFVRWALADSITIFGLVLATLGARWEIVGALPLLGIGTHLWLRPG